jgi:hypothetical protein
MSALSKPNDNITIIILEFVCKADKGYFSLGVTWSVESKPLSLSNSTDDS